MSTTTALGSEYSTANQLRFLAFVLTPLVMMFYDVLLGILGLVLVLLLISAWARQRD